MEDRSMDGPAAEQGEDHVQDKCDYNFDSPSENVVSLIHGIEHAMSDIDHRVGAALSGCDDLVTPVNAMDALRALAELDAFDDMVTPVIDRDSLCVADQKTPVKGVDYEAAVASMFGCPDTPTMVVKDLNEKTVNCSQDNLTALASYSVRHEDPDFYDTVDLCVLDRKAEGYLSVVDRQNMPFRPENLLNVMGFVSGASDNEMAGAYSIVMGICKEKGWTSLEAVAMEGYTKHMRKLYDCRSG